MKRQVRPSVKWLIDIGLQEKVQEALGMQLNLFDINDERTDF
jgi:hypothetical protein